MASQVSPGVVINEIDLSQYAARISTSVVGLVGGATKGPINEPTFITNELQFVETFGEPVSAVSGDGESSPGYSYLGHAALQYLRNGNQLWVVRVESSSSPAVAATANANSASNGTGTDILQIDAKTKGGWANSGAADEGVRVVFTDPDNGLASYYRNVTVYYRGTVVESYPNIAFGDSSVASYGVGTKDSNGRLHNAEDVINAVSDYIEVTCLAATSTPPAGTTASPYTVALTGGKNGIAGMTASDFIGQANPTDSSYTGMRAFLDTANLDINLLAVPGETDDEAVLNELVSICETRGDCLGIIDPPDLSSPQDIVDWTNGTYSGGPSSAINSSYVAVFWPWVKYYDPYNEEDAWTPPSGWVLSQFAYNDRVADPWFAAAGFTRGRLVGALDIRRNTKVGERELLYGGGNIVNPIVNFAKDGLVVWGQRTAQRIPSALDRINVRRMMLHAEKVIATSIRFLVFEPNDSVTWRRFVGIVTPVLDGIKARRGITKFQVICDDTTNTETLINQNTMRGIILIQPTKTAEVITVEFKLLATGAQFQELAAA